MGATRVRLAELDVHDPAGRGPAGAVLVLHGAPAAIPVLPPDPLEVVHLEHEERDDPEENLRPGHDPGRIGTAACVVNGPSGLSSPPSGQQRKEAARPWIAAPSQAQPILEAT